MLRKNTKWKWGNAEEKAFQESKLLFNKSNLLINYDPNKTSFSTMWSIPYSAGAVMFASRTLSKAENNYSQIKKE